MFSKDLEFTIGQCYKQAREQRHEFMTVEHLLLSLLDNPSAVAVLRACGADLARLGSDLKNIIAETVPVLSGVAASDWIVAAGGHLLREGQVVAPVDRDNRPVGAAPGAR